MLIAITNTPRDYSWGSVDLIAGLEGRTPTGAPEAEIWYGDHPGSPSRVVGTETTLDAALTSAAEPALPFLMKLLAAGSSLSIQAHPTKAQAVAGFAREEQSGLPRDAGDRLYRDDNHKPEIIVALSDPFRALVGLRPVAATRRLLARLAGGPAIAHLDGLLADADEEHGLRAALEWALSQATDADVAELTAALGASDDAEFAPEITALRAAASDFPGDRGLYVALLMNLVTLRPGDALFAPAGVLHAYQSGLGVELMAASDNVLRGGLTPKHVDVPELLAVLDATAGPAPLVIPREVAPGVVEYAVAVPDFALTRVTAAGAPVPVALRGPAIVLATAGEVTASDGTDAVTLAPGRAVYVGGGSDEVVLSGVGEAFVAQRGEA
ncbi:MAG: mannose-6-phosphate isomerase, class I [Microbacterium sp. SCN 70-200]|uniref:mannose-6-phosphate isomerase, class I n=1 Tax=unclassified Microbacterium TaxID=2609290 RepID=UPI00086C875E|nr:MULTISPECIES: mannose-6-phosphate isomerase, class I [unclassified Microbacterium]MBN9213872.1 mannose-6-phosphate isomerase, class I [Microbacterium sp.]ODT42423.1 MAG: mannose-6-phosphate isomerase, class I [Microbacterium sp. SCN 70-200]OJV85449.1 MAG: mannose-6-phosphate isomerase, class I [Microbacterium sp. 70-16]